MRNWIANAALRIAAAFPVRTATAALAVSMAATAASTPAGAKPYGRGEDLLLRMDPWYGDPLWMVSWVFWALALFVGGWAVLRFKAHVENPRRGGLAMPVVGIAVAVALSQAPTLIDVLVEGLPPGYRPPVWRGSGSYGPVSEDLLLRVRYLPVEAPWVFYALAALVGSGAILSFMAEAGNPEREGLPMQVVGILLALALLASPWLVAAFVDGLSLEYRPAVRFGRDS